MLMAAMLAMALAYAAPMAFAQDGQYQAPEGVSQPVDGGSIPAGIQGPCPEGQVTQTGSDACVPEEDFLTCEEVYGPDYCVAPEETATEGQQYEVGPDNIIDVPPGPGRCEGIIDQARYEACVAQYQPVTGTDDGELLQSGGTGTAAPTAAVTATAAPTLPDTGGPSLLPIAGLLLAGAVLSVGVIARRR
jgi:hypothetical protein